MKSFCTVEILASGLLAACASGCMRVDGGERDVLPTQEIVRALRDVGAKIDSGQTENRTAFERLSSGLNQLSDAAGRAEHQQAMTIADAGVSMDKKADAYTGAIVYVRTDGSCPYCDRLVRDLKARAKDGWRVGPGPTDHFRIVDAADLEIATPTVVYFKEGKKVGTIVGYGSTRDELNAILVKHPAHNPKRPFATAVKTSAAASQSVEDYLLDIDHRAPTQPPLLVPPTVFVEGFVIEGSCFVSGCP